MNDIYYKFEKVIEHYKKNKYPFKFKFIIDDNHYIFVYDFAILTKHKDIKIDILNCVICKQIKKYNTRPKEGVIAFLQKNLPDKFKSLNNQIEELYLGVL